MQHLNVLLASELATLRRVGTRRLYPAKRRALARLRAEFGVFWDTGLARLQVEAEAAERKAEAKVSGQGVIN